MPILKCKICQDKFYAKPNWIIKGWGKYCSRKCHYEDNRRGKFVNCFICSQEIYRSPKELRKSKSKKYFCNKICQTIWRNQEFRGPRHANWKGGEHIEYREIMLKNKIKQICKLCHCHDKRVLCVHHLDKNKKNNNIKNLMWLCYNCHYLVHQYNTSIKK